MKLSAVGIGAKFLFMPRVLGTLAIGCSSPRSVGIQFGDPGYRGVQKHPGPPLHAPAHGYRKKFAYYYYPTVNVYYHPARDMYFYLSGSEWKMAVS